MMAETEWGERPSLALAPEPAELDSLRADEERLAATLARRSMVLAENDGILPLAESTGRIAIIGPIADSARDLLGDYAHLLHIETLAELRHRANPFGFPKSDLINPVDELSGIPTVRDAIREPCGPDRVVHGRGCASRDGTDAE